MPLLLIFISFISVSIGKKDTSKKSSLNLNKSSKVDQNLLNYSGQCGLVELSRWLVPRLAARQSDIFTFGIKMAQTRTDHSIACFQSLTIIMIKEGFQFRGITPNGLPQ